MTNKSLRKFKRVSRDVFLHPVIIFKGIGKWAQYLYRIVKFRSFNVNVNDREFWNRKLSRLGDFWRDAHYKLILDLLPENGEFSLLDVGCALGDGCRLIARNFSKARVTGIDISEVGISKARRKSGDVTYRVLDILKDDVDRTYDYITILQTLEHFDDPFFIVDKLLSKCKKALIVSVPYTPEHSGELRFVDEHRYFFNEDTFKAYDSDVARITDFIAETSGRCIIYMIKPKQSSKTE